MTFAQFATYWASAGLVTLALFTAAAWGHRRTLPGPLTALVLFFLWPAPVWMFLRALVREDRK